MDNPYLETQHNHNGDFCDGCINAMQHEELVELQKETNQLLRFILDEIRGSNSMLDKLESIRYSLSIR